MTMPLTRIGEQNFHLMVILDLWNWWFIFTKLKPCQIFRSSFIQSFFSSCRISHFIHLLFFSRSLKRSNLLWFHHIWYDWVVKTFHNQFQIHLFEGGQIPRSSNCLERLIEALLALYIQEQGYQMVNCETHQSPKIVYLNDVGDSYGLLFQCLSNEEA